MRATRAAVLRSSGGTTATRSEREVVEAIFRSYGLPGWLGWGTYGAESSYGQAPRTGLGRYLFGGIDLPHGTTSNLTLAARESARAYKHWLESTGSLAAAVQAYSGGSYTISHPEELGKGSSGGQGKRIDVSFLEGIPLLESLNPENWLKKNPSETPPGKEIPRVEKGVETASEGLSSLTHLAELLGKGETWIRIGEVLAGAVLIYLGLRGLTDTGVSDLPGAGAVRAAARI